MADRYFVETPISEDRAVLTGSEAHHLIHVMRAKPGSPAVLFDGRGAEFAARVERLERSEVELTVTARREVDRELPHRLTLGVALPKGDRQKWLVEKAVELGVHRLVPLKTNRCVAQPVQRALDRLRRTVIEASKQCGRNRLMEITRPQAFADYVADAQNVPHRLLAHPHGPEKRAGVFAATGLPGPVQLAVGPEGGWTDEEVGMAVAAGWQPIDLGPRILRVETAAILLVAMVTPWLASAGHHG